MSAKEKLKDFIPFSAPFGRDWFYRSAFRSSCLALAKVNRLQVLRLVLPWGLKPYVKESFVLQQDLDHGVVIDSQEKFLAWIRVNGFWSTLMKLQKSVSGLHISVVRLCVPVSAFGGINDYPHWHISFLKRAARCGWEIQYAEYGQNGGTSDGTYNVVPDKAAPSLGFTGYESDMEIDKDGWIKLADGP